MSETETTAATSEAAEAVQPTEPEEPSESLLEQIDRRVTALHSAEKLLKKRSTISFAERRDLSHKATKAAAELSALRGEAEGQETPSEALQAALAGADRVLGLIEGAHPAALHHRAPGNRTLPNQQRRGMGGMSSQQRPPDRIGE